mmetsp:Transcript_70839/g.107184  ORF Transcript_70839/g.107184 Transcript_70839/m.107184 type:complete len:80 (-) Transcript_70839:1081-1320(-)
MHRFSIHRQSAVFIQISVLLLSIKPCFSSSRDSNSSYRSELRRNNFSISSNDKPLVSGSATYNQNDPIIATSPYNPKAP